jgi:hypothetical protein
LEAKHGKPSVAVIDAADMLPRHPDPIGDACAHLTAYDLRPENWRNGSCQPQDWTQGPAEAAVALRNPSRTVSHRGFSIQTWHERWLKPDNSPLHAANASIGVSPVATLGRIRQRPLG